MNKNKIFVYIFALIKYVFELESDTHYITIIFSVDPRSLSTFLRFLNTTYKNNLCRSRTFVCHAQQVLRDFFCSPSLYLPPGTDGICRLLWRVMQSREMKHAGISRCHAPVFTHAKQRPVPFLNLQQTVHAVKLVATSKSLPDSQYSWKGG